VHFDLAEAIARFLALMPALTFHEFAHAYSAYRFGDPTPKIDGRVSLNPLDHLDPIGTLMILFAPIGWAKPVRVNPYNMREPDRHLMISTACGPLANIAQGIVFGLIVRVLWRLAPGLTTDSYISYFLVMLVLIPFALALFNLIPLGPLDGHEVLRYFLPYDMKVKYNAFNQRYGMMALLGLILLGPLAGLHVIGYVLQPAWWMVRLLIW
jgi:Zn-dependent protease